MSNSKYDVRFQWNNRSYVLKEFSLKEDRATLNLLALFTRKRGEVLYVNSSGCLEKVVGVGAWLKYKCHQSQENARLQAAVNEALEQFSTYVSEVKEQKVATLFAKALFNPAGTQGIGRLSKTLYNKNILKAPTSLKKHLIPKRPFEALRVKLPNHEFVDLTHVRFPQLEGPRSVSIDLGNAILNHNLCMLLKRKKGQVYQVNGEGKLEKVRHKFFYLWQKKAVQSRVQECVTATMQQLNIFYAKRTMNLVDKVVLQTIFSPQSSLCRMSSNVFYRGVIEEDSAIETAIAPNFGAIRERLTQALKRLNLAKTPKAKNNAKLQVESTFMNLAVAEFEFAKRLGKDLERNHDGGSGGARYARDRYGRKILVIKPNDEGPHGVNNPHWFARWKQFLVDPKPCLDGNSEAMAEYHSRTVDRAFEIWSVPPTDIRYIASENFVGKKYKECSVQMYKEGCQTLGDYIDVSPRLHWFPRRFLRWYCGSSYTPFNRILGQRTERNEELSNKLPLISMHRVSIHNAVTEDLDCHFENILIHVSDPADKEGFLHQLINGQREIPEEEIRTVVNSFFKTQNNQTLLELLLFSEEIVDQEGKRKKITLVKHDGGSSLPHTHPGSWDLLSLRFKHLFEVLPHFEVPFSPNARSLLIDKEEIFAKFLLEMGVRSIRNIVSQEVFEEFWKYEKNRQNLKGWIFERDEYLAENYKESLLAGLKMAVWKIKRDELNQKIQEKHGREDPDLLNKAIESFEKREGFDTYKYFSYHLRRIRGNLQTRIDSFCILRKCVNSDEQSRYFFKNVRTNADFIRESKDLDRLTELLDIWKSKPVLKENVIAPNAQAYIAMDMKVMFQQLGETYR